MNFSNRLFRLLFPLLALAFVRPAFAQTCPAYQTYNGAGACVYTNYLDSPAYLTGQNTAIANSLNALPNGPAAAFAHQYGSLPINQQMAIMDCQLGMFNASYFAQPAPSGCPTVGGRLEHRGGDRGESGARQSRQRAERHMERHGLLACCASQPGPVIPAAPVAPAPATGNMVGALDYATSTSCVFFATPAAMKDSMTPETS